MNLADPNDVAAARLRVLEGTLDKLPRTADGEIILPGKTVYQAVHGISLTKHGPRGTYIAELDVTGLALFKGRIVPFSDDTYYDLVPESLWSSRELAEVAAKGNRKADPVLRREARK